MSCHYGNIAELQFLLEATKKGLIVSKPQTISTPYDFLIDNGKSVLKIQVKSCFMEGPRFETTVAKGKETRTSYTKSDCDFISVFIAKHFLWFLIPIEELSPIKKITILPFGESKWNKYREDWGALLKQ